MLKEVLVDVDQDHAENEIAERDKGVSVDRSQNEEKNHKQVPARVNPFQEQLGELVFRVA
jgi:hypothetical protein